MSRNDLMVAMSHIKERKLLAQFLDLFPCILPGHVTSSIYVFAHPVLDSHAGPGLICLNNHW